MSNWACGQVVRWSDGQVVSVVGVVSVVSVAREEFDLYLGWKALADKGYSAKINLKKKIFYLISSEQKVLFEIAPVLKDGFIQGMN